MPLPKPFALMVSKTVKLTNSRYLLKWEVSAFCVILLSLPPPHSGKWLFKTINSLLIISNVCYTGTQLFFYCDIVRQWHLTSHKFWQSVFCGNTVTQHSYNAWPNQTISSLEFCFQELFWSGKHKDKELMQWLFNHSTVWPQQSPVCLIRKGDKNKPFDGTGWQSGQG